LKRKKKRQKLKKLKRKSRKCTFENLKTESFNLQYENLFKIKKQKKNNVNNSKLTNLMVDINANSVYLARNIKYNFFLLIHTY
jgi:hypothetical protein